MLCQWSVIRSLLAIVQWWGFNVTVIIMNKWIFQVSSQFHLSDFSPSFAILGFTSILVLLLLESLSVTCLFPGFSFLLLLICNFTLLVLNFRFHLIFAFLVLMFLGSV